MTIAAKLRVHRGPDFALDVDIEVPSKGVTSIFGPSGCCRPAAAPHWQLKKTLRTVDNHAEVLSRAKYISKRDCERLLAELRPRPTSADSIRRLPKAPSEAAPVEVARFARRRLGLIIW